MTELKTNREIFEEVRINKWVKWVSNETNNKIYIYMSGVTYLRDGSIEIQNEFTFGGRADGKFFCNVSFSGNFGSGRFYSLTKRELERKNKELILFKLGGKGKSD